MGDAALVWFAGDAHHPARLAINSLRIDVFVGEQKVPLVLEIDARDFLASTTHVALVDEGVVVACARILREGENLFRVGRVAVARERRGQGTGATLMTRTHELIRQGLARGDRSNQESGGSPATPSLPPVRNRAHLVLDAQVQVADFYRSVGYELADDEPFWEAGIAHVRMQRAIDLSYP